MQKVQKGTHPDPLRLGSGQASTPTPFDWAQDRLRQAQGLRSARPGILSVAQAKSKEAAGWVLLFFRCRRAAATAIGAAVVTLMSVGGFALTSDHIHLVHQRDTLKAATDAASFATTRHWQQALRHLTDDDQIKAALLPMARRYILANIPENRRGQAESTLQVQLTLHHGTSMVDVNAAADLSDGLFFSGWMFNDDTPEIPTTMRVETRTERIESESGVIEVALALDVTGSMTRTISGRSSRSSGEDSRMTIVKRAAQDLIDILTATGSSVAIGVVPWDFRVRLDATTRTRWEDNSYAQYPTQRYYQNPYKASTQGEWQTLPATRPEAWNGCLDQRAISGDNPPGLSAALPATTPFYMAFYTPMLSLYNNRPSNNRSDHRVVAYECHGDDPHDTSQQETCYSDAAYWSNRSPQFECRTVSTSSYYTPAIMPLTTDIATVKSKIQGLQAKGKATNSTLGVAWGHRLLASSWRTVWGDDATHPVDQAEGVQKALVLLTDGEDNYPDTPGNVGAGSFSQGRKVIAARLNQACTATKNAGIKVFTIAAMQESRVGELGDALTACSSQADDPNGNYVFINNATSEDLEGAFRQIARQLVRFRRIY